MGIYDSNTGSIAIPGNTFLPSLNSNRGTIFVGPNCKISECNDNRGTIKFACGLRIENINKNYGHVSIANWSKVDLIANNRGSIVLASDCVLMNTTNNFGSIVGGKPGKPNFASAACKFLVGAHSSRESSSHYNDRKIFNPSFLNAGGSSNQDILGNLLNLNGSMLGSFGLHSLNLHSSLQSNSYENKIQPSKIRKDVPIPSAPLLDADRKENCAVPNAPSLNDADQALCAICLERPRNVAFQCGHLCCANCSEQLRTCHMCRVKITQKINLFL